MIPRTHEEAYQMIQDGLNYLEQVGEIISTTEGPEILLIGETSDVLWDKGTQRWKFQVHMGIRTASDAIRDLEKLGAEAELKRSIFENSGTPPSEDEDSQSGLGFQ